MRLALLSVCGALAAGPAFADAIEGKKSGADILGASAAADWREIPAEELLIIELERGKVHVALSPALAPMHVAQVKNLAREGFYDGLSFYRVIDGFVAQGGDPFGEKTTTTSKKALKAEFEGRLAKGFAFNPLGDADGYAPEAGFVASLPAGFDAATGAAWHLHCAGAFAFGREDGRDTASTEFYVALQPQRYLDRNLSVFGRVIDGMEHLQALRRVAPPEKKTDDLGEKIVSIRVAADVPEVARERFEILDSARPVFAEYAEARRNRPEAFFYFRPDYLDICQLPVPVRKKAAS
ncbi:MAG TPA: peptidylprolyl isomerase [Parvularcula sp.]|nr:peptidylprolyl isomerase [Parvularcula sp.]HBS30484.1 peptidylprolyl isomerase [Parvularcula sp.]